MIFRTSRSGAPAARRLSRGPKHKGRVNAFGECRRGSTAVEFAIVATPFIMTVFSTFEVGWFFFANSVVDAAAINAARIVRTGEAQEAGMSKQAFYDAICPRVSVLGSCSTRLTVEVRTFASFAALAADNSAAVCADGLPAAVGAIPYQPGIVSQIVRVRICYLYDTLNPALGVNLAETENGRRRLIATHLFRNEPF